MTPIRLIGLLGVLAAAGCGDDLETPTAATEVTASTVLFAGTLQPRSTRFYSYTVTTGGTVTAMLASLERSGTLAPATNRLEIGIGTPAGTGCAVQEAVNTPPSLVPQVTQTAAVGVHCVRVSDLDGLPGPMSFTIRVIHP